MKPIVIVAGSSARSLSLFRTHLLKTLVELGYDVVATAGDIDEGATPIIEATGARWIPIEFHRRAGNPFPDLAYAAAMRRLTRELKPLALITYTHKPNTFGVMGARLARSGARVYSMVAGLGQAFGADTTPGQRVARGMVELLYRLSTRQMSGIVFQNPDDRRFFQSRGLLPAGLPTAVVRGSGVSLEEFPEQPLPSGPMKFLLVARLLRAKGIEEYAAAARVLKASHPDAEFHLIGPTASGSSAVPVAAVEAWQREGVLVYHGEHPHVGAALATCSVFVLPTYYPEGTPRTVLEAMATGRAIVTTDTPGARETVDRPAAPGPDGVAEGTNGFLIQPRSVEALTAAMRRFIDDPALAGRMGRASREAARAHYDVVSVTRSMLSFMSLT